jgi:hypothetical protein
MDQIGIFDGLIGVDNDVVRHPENSQYRTLGLILRAGVFNGMLVTVLAALMAALFSGAGIEDKFSNVGCGATQHGLWTNSWHPIEFGKAVLWLCPFTAVICGSFGLFSGLAVGGLMYLRVRRIRSTKRFIGETAILGFLLGCLFPLFDVWTGPGQGQGVQYPAVDLLAPAFGGLCGFVCSLCYRRRFFAGAKGNATSLAAC